MEVIHSVDLIRFIDNLDIDIDGEVITNVIDHEEPNFISRFYTPNLKVSGLGSEVLKKIDLQELTQTGRRLSNNTLVIDLINSDLKVSNPYMYKLAQSVVLESFAIVHAIEEDATLLVGIEPKDLSRTRENIKYLVDYLGTDNKYTSIVERLHALSIAIGYIELQLPSIKGGLDG